MLYLLAYPTQLGYYSQEVKRLEKELNKLTYDSTDPIAWAVKIRSLVAKLTLRQTAPNERTVRSLMLGSKHFREIYVPLGRD